MFKKGDTVILISNFENWKKGSTATVLEDKIWPHSIEIIRSGYIKTIDETLVEIFKKEDKVEKIEVRSWEDLVEFSVKGLWDNKRIKYNDVEFLVLEKDIEKAVNLLNALGGNFEYKEVEVIDTLEKWEEFQTKIAKEGFHYDRIIKDFFYAFKNIHNNGCWESSTLMQIESKYDVDLKILKEAE